MVQVLSAIKMVKLLYKHLAFKEDLYIAEFDRDTKLYKVVESAPALETFAEIYQGLVMATRDYVERSGFPGVILGLSGGIDSALTLISQLMQSVQREFKL